MGRGGGALFYFIKKLPQKKIEKKQKNFLFFSKIKEKNQKKIIWLCVFTFFTLKNFTLNKFYAKKILR